MTIRSSARFSLPPLVAHRGASHQAPENTMPSFRLAWQEQAQRIEGDFWMTADKEIVCIHDHTTERTAPGLPVLDVRHVPYHDFSHYDVGIWKSEEFRGTMVPTLPEILAEMPAGSMIYIEIKQDNPEIITNLLEIVEQSPVRMSQVVLISFSPAIIRQAKKMIPQLKVLLIYAIDGIAEERAGGIEVEQLPDFARSLGANGVDFGKNKRINNELVSALRARGLEFHVWTVNSLEDALQYIKLGVDSITTDRPRGLLEELEAYFNSSQ